MWFVMFLWYARSQRWTICMWRVGLKILRSKKQTCTGGKNHTHAPTHTHTHSRGHAPFSSSQAQPFYPTQTLTALAWYSCARVCARRAKKGKGSFNWRMKWPVLLPMKFPRFNLQLWDKDITARDDCIGSAMIPLDKLFLTAMKAKCVCVYIYRYICVNIYVCMYVCVKIYVCVYI